MEHAEEFDWETSDIDTFLGLPTEDLSMKRALLTAAEMHQHGLLNNEEKTAFKQLILQKDPKLGHDLSTFQQSNLSQEDRKNSLLNLKQTLRESSRKSSFGMPMTDDGFDSSFDMNMEMFDFNEHGHGQMHGIFDQQSLMYGQANQTHVPSHYGNRLPQGTGFHHSQQAHPHYQMHPHSQQVQQMQQHQLQQRQVVPRQNIQSGTGVVASGAALRAPPSQTREKLAQSSSTAQDRSNTSAPVTTSVAAKRKGTQAQGNKAGISSSAVTVAAAASAARRNSQQGIGNSKFLTQISSGTAAVVASLSSVPPAPFRMTMDSIDLDADLDNFSAKEKKNERERRRRLQVSYGFTDLLKILKLPDDSKIEKSYVLTTSIERINELDAVRKSLRAKNKELKEEAQRLGIKI